LWKCPSLSSTARRKAELARQRHAAAVADLAAAPSEADLDAALNHVNACHASPRAAKAEEKRTGDAEALRVAEARTALAACVRAMEEAAARADRGGGEARGELSTHTCV